MDGVKVKVVSGHMTPSMGSAGLRSQVPGAMASVSNLAGATGGIGPGKSAERDSK